jgi:hypothetical protein
MQHIPDNNTGGSEENMTTPSKTALGVLARRWSTQSLREMRSNPAIAASHAGAHWRAARRSHRRPTFWRRTLLALLASTLLGGCVVAADPLPPPAVAVAYSPYYYDGYPVYYDGVGVPFIYFGGGVHYVPRSYSHYDVLVGGYHGPHYVTRGYVDRGYASRGYAPHAYASPHYAYRHR